MKPRLGRRGAVRAAGSAPQQQTRHGHFVCVTGSFGSRKDIDVISAEFAKLRFDLSSDPYWYDSKRATVPDVQKTDTQASKDGAVLPKPCSYSVHLLQQTADVVEADARYMRLMQPRPASWQPNAAQTCANIGLQAVVGRAVQRTAGASYIGAA